MEDVQERERRGETRSWYRVPSRGLTAGSKRIAEAVDNESWQKFRHSMKGKSTAVKIDMLEEYWDKDHEQVEHTMSNECDICVRVHNYIGALCRGGQLEAGTGLDHLINRTIRNYIKK